MGDQLASKSALLVSREEALEADAKLAEVKKTYYSLINLPVTLSEGTGHGEKVYRAERAVRVCEHVLIQFAQQTLAARPTPGKLSGTELKVVEQIAKRQQLGIAKYGQIVADNPLSLREWLQHALEECLDQAIYLQRAIDELETRNGEGTWPTGNNHNAP